MSSHVGGHTITIKAKNILESFREDMAQLGASECKELKNSWMRIDHEFNEKFLRKRIWEEVQLNFQAVGLQQNLKNKRAFFFLTTRQHCVKSVKIRSFFCSVFSRIRTEYGDLRSKSPYSVRIRQSTDKKKLYIWTLFTQCRDWIVSINQLNYNWLS